MNSHNVKDWTDVIPASVETLHVFPKHRAETPRTDYLTQFYNQYPLKSTQTWISHSIWGYGALLTANPSKEAVHQHWLEATNVKGVLGWCWKWVCLQIFLLRGGQLIWTCHNVEPHERTNRWLNEQIQQWLLHHASSIIVHCSGTLSRINRTHEDVFKRLFVAEHPSFVIHKGGKSESRFQIKQNLDLDDNLLSNNILLYFGNIASYKQIPESIDLFIDKEDYVFWIVGPAKPDGAQTLEWLSQQAAIHPNRFWIHPVHVTDEETDIIVSAADVMMFNHRAIEMSGGVALGLSAGIPTVAPATGCLNERPVHASKGLQREHLHTFSSPVEMVRIVEKLCAS